MSTSSDIIMALCLKNLVSCIQDTIIATQLEYNSQAFEFIRLYRNIRLCRIHAYALDENLYYNLDSNLSKKELDELMNQLFEIELAVTYAICGEKELAKATILRDKLVNKVMEMEHIKKRGDVIPKFNVAILRHFGWH